MSINGRDIFGDQPEPKIPTTLEDLEQLVADAARIEAGEDLGPESSVPDEDAQESDWPDWPEAMGEEAFYGPMGNYVRLVSPQSEADPHALLLTGLVIFGAIVDREPHFTVEATRHGTNLFLVLAGDTAKARKGTATDRSLDIFSDIDPEFMTHRKMSGLSTGQGLIEKVKDERKEMVLVSAKGETPEFKCQLVDPGVDDKRLLAIESEFSAVLQAMTREGNNLSSTLRDAYDGKPLSSLARSNKDSCQQPHIALIGNITIEEVQRLLTTNDKANGFGNRILWCCCRRSKLLPLGGKPLDPIKRQRVVDALRKAREFAGTVGAISFDEETEKTWKTTYRELNKPAHGIFGQMTARSEPHTRRLAILFALLDCSSVICKEHLAAAVSVWFYCEDSVRCIFGDSLGDETADAILRMLRAAPEGMTRTEINRGFGSHKSAAELDRALAVLVGRKRAVSERIETGGGPAILWRATSA